MIPKGVKKRQEHRCSSGRRRSEALRDVNVGGGTLAFPFGAGDVAAAEGHDSRLTQSEQFREVPVGGGGPQPVGRAQVGASGSVELELIGGGGQAIADGVLDEPFPFGENDAVGDAEFLRDLPLVHDRP